MLLTMEDRAAVRALRSERPDDGDAEKELRRDNDDLMWDLFKAVASLGKRVKQLELTVSAANCLGEKLTAMMAEIRSRGPDA